MTLDTLLWFAVTYAQAVLAVSAGLAAARILIGPRAEDRVLGLDALYLTVMLQFIVTGLRLGTPFLFEAALAMYRKRGFVNGWAFADYVASDFNQFLHLDLQTGG